MMIENAIRFYHANEDNDQALFQVFQLLATETVFLPVNQAGSLLSLQMGNDDVIPIFTSESNVPQNEPIELRQVYLKDYKNALTYDLKIWKDQLWQGDAYKIIWDLTGNSAQVSLPPGYYEAYVDSRNGALINMSNNVVKFTVPEGSPENSTIEKPSETDDNNTNKDSTSTSTGKKPLYCMTFDVNNGNPLENKYKYIYSGNALGTLPVPSRENYVFKGWYLQKTGGLRVSEKTIANSNARLYARWERVLVSSVSNLNVWNESGRKAYVIYGEVKGASGYEILFSTDKKFKRNTKRITTTATSRTVTELSKGKTYYFKVRVYKVDSTGQKIYGSYSKVKKVKIQN